MSRPSGAQIGPVADRIREIPEATAARLSRYLRTLLEHPGIAGRIGVRSQDLAAAAGVDAALLRRDLSFLGTHGVRGVGYEVATLTASISRALGAHTAHAVALVGVGHLGRALAGYSGLAGHGFDLVALFDRDPAIVGTQVAGLVVADVADAPAVLAGAGATIGIIATAAESAQQVADLLVAAGIRSVLNFAPVALELPADVHLRQVDLGLELQMLAFHEARRDPAADHGGTGGLSPTAQAP